LAWSGTALLIGVSGGQGDDGSMQTFNCGPAPGTSPFQCSFVSKILFATSAAEFGADIATADQFVAVAAPGTQQVGIYTISSLLDSTTPSGLLVPPLATITMPGRAQTTATTDFGRSIALFAAPGSTDTDAASSTHNGMLLAVSDDVFTNGATKAFSTGRVFIYTSASDATQWSLTQTLVSPTFNATPPIIPALQDKFYGDELVFNSKGILAVGVGYTGSVYLYDCDSLTCLPLKQGIISPPAEVLLDKEDDRVFYALAINKDMLIVGQPSTKGEVGATYLYGLTQVSGAPSPQPTVAPHRIVSSLRPTFSPTGFYDSYRFVLSQTLVPDASDSLGINATSPFFGSNVAINDNNLIAVGSPGSNGGFGTVYLYHCPEATQCDGKGGKSYFQKLDCFSRDCSQGVDYTSDIALSATGALLAKGNEGASLGSVVSPTDNGNVQLWWADDRIPLTFSPTPDPTLAPTLAPSALPTLGPTPAYELTTSVPTPTINSPDRFESFFTVVQQFTGPSLDMAAVRADNASIAQTLQLTISEVWRHPFDAVQSDISADIPPAAISILNIEPVPAGQVTWRPKDPAIRRLQGTAPTIAVTYAVKFDYIALGWANEGLYALFDALVRELRNDISQDTAVTNQTAGLEPSYFEESWFTQHMRYNAPDMSCLKSADSAISIPDPVLVALTQGPSAPPSPRPTGTSNPTTLPTRPVSTESSASLKSKANITVISSVTIVVFVLAIAAMYYYRQWLLNKNGRDKGDDDNYEDDYQFNAGHDAGQAVNPIYSSEGGGARIDFDGSPHDSSAFRRASGWSGPAAGPAYPTQQLQPPQHPGVYESPAYMDQNNPGFKIVQRASLMPTNTQRGSISRLSPAGSSIQPPAAPPLMAPP